jgi:hypothetical protein
LRTLLIRFVITASLARLLDEGLALAVVLLALQRTGSTAEAGVVVAMATFPQLLAGPLLGPVLDRAAHPWSLVRAAGIVSAAAVGVIALGLGRTTSAVPLAGALVMATAAPLLNGGVSALAARATWSPRVFAWDSLAYNVAGLGGPALVTAVALTASPAWAVAALGMACGALALTSLGLTSSPLPTSMRRASTGRTIAAAVRIMIEDPPLRAVTLSTTVAFGALGGLSFALVAATTALGRDAADAGVALTVSALGGLVGSLLMIRRPPLGRPARTVLVCLAAVGALLILMSAGWWPLLLAGSFAIGVVDAPLLVGLFATRTSSSSTGVRATVFTIGASAKLGAAAVGAVVAGRVLDGRATGVGLAAIGLVHAAAAAAGWLNLRPGRPGPAPAPETSPSRPRPAARR